MPLPSGAGRRDGGEPGCTGCACSVRGTRPMQWGPVQWVPDDEQGFWPASCRPQRAPHARCRRHGGGQLAGRAPPASPHCLRCHGPDRSHCLHVSPGPAARICKDRAGGRAVAQNPAVANNHAGPAIEGPVSQSRTTAQSQGDGHRAAGTIPARRRRAPLPFTGDGSARGAGSYAPPTPGAAGAPRRCNPRGPAQSHYCEQQPLPPGGRPR